MFFILIKESLDQKQIEYKGYARRRVIFQCVVSGGISCARPCPTHVLGVGFNKERGRCKEYPLNKSPVVASFADVLAFIYVGRRGVRRGAATARGEASVRVAGCGSVRIGGTHGLCMMLGSLADERSMARPQQPTSKLRLLNNASGRFLAFARATTAPPPQPSDNRSVISQDVLHEFILGL